MVGVLAIVASGLIADRVGRRTLLGVSAVADRAPSAASRRSCSTAATSAKTIFMLVGFALLGLSFGQSSGAVNVELPAAATATPARR